MQNQRLFAMPLPPAGAFNQCRGIVAGLTLMNLPRDQLAAEQVDHGIQVEELPAYQARQIRHIPTPDLIWTAGDMTHWLRLRWRLAAATMVLLPRLS
jgi:hypothetical protein